MPLTRDEATSTLRDIAKAERRSFSAFGYKSGAPHLILWGLVWVLGYGGTYLYPAEANPIWLTLAGAGAVASTVIGMRSKPKTKQKFSWRIFFTWLAAMGALSSIASIFAPVNGMQVGSLFPLAIGWAYVIMGIWLGGRFAIAGLVVVALTLFGFFHLDPQQFLLWMAFLGGATLIGTGLWLRTV
jgi:hypothetical protein